MSKEAHARIKINKLLEEAGWRFFSENGKPANIVLENKTTLTRKRLEEFGDNFQNTKNGFIDICFWMIKVFPLLF